MVEGDAPLAPFDFNSIMTRRTGNYFVAHCSLRACVNTYAADVMDSTYTEALVSSTTHKMSAFTLMRRAIWSTARNKISRSAQ